MLTYGVSARANVLASTKCRPVRWS